MSNFSQNLSKKIYNFQNFFYCPLIAPPPTVESLATALTLNHNKFLITVFYLFGQPLIPVVVAIPEKLSFPVVQSPLEPHLKSAQVVLPNIGEPSLVLNVGPSDVVQLNHTNLRTTTLVEFCSNWHNCQLSGSRRSSSAFSASLQRKRRSLQVQKVTGEGPKNEATCAKNGTIIPIDVNEYCENYWKPCPNWDPVAGTCTILYDIAGPSDLQIHENPCWFRVTVSNVAYNRSALLHTPPHRKILKPDPVDHLSLYRISFKYRIYTSR